MRESRIVGRCAEPHWEVVALSLVRFAAAEENIGGLDPANRRRYASTEQVEWMRNVTVGLLCCLFVVLPARAQKKAPVAKAKSAKQMAFERLDRISDETLDVEEFIDGSVGRAADNERKEFAELDLDDDGLSFEEFRHYENPHDKFNPEGWFKYMDSDKDEFVSWAEFVEGREDESEILKKRFSDIDSDGSGTLTLNEFTSKHKAWQQEGQVTRQPSGRWTAVRRWLTGIVVTVDLLVVGYFVWYVTGRFRRPSKTAQRGAPTEAGAPTRPVSPSQTAGSSKPPKSTRQVRK